MKTEDAKKKLKSFVSTDKIRIALRDIAVSDGIAYATDGRIGVMATLDDGCADDSVPDRFPLQELRNILSGSRANNGWMSLDRGRFEEGLALLKDQLAAENEEIKRDYCRNYEAVTCPACGELVWYNTMEKELELEMEPHRLLEMRDITFPVRLNFGDGVDHLFNLGYVATVVKKFGDSLAFAIDSDGKLLFRGEGVFGVLMPMRGKPDATDFGIDMHGLGDVGNKEGAV